MIYYLPFLSILGFIIYCLAESKGYHRGVQDGRNTIIK